MSPTTKCSASQTGSRVPPLRSSRTSIREPCHRPSPSPSQSIQASKIPTIELRNAAVESSIPGPFPASALLPPPTPLPAADARRPRHATATPTLRVRSVGRLKRFRAAAPAPPSRGYYLSDARPRHARGTGPEQTRAATRSRRWAILAAVPAAPLCPGALCRDHDLLAVYGLLFKSGEKLDPGHPLSTIPDNFGEFDPATRGRRSAS